MSVKLLSLKEAVQAHLSLQLTKCHIVGNHMSQLNYLKKCKMESFYFIFISGLQFRYRTCDNPTPSYNGRNCLGDAKDVQLCTRTCTGRVKSSKFEHLVISDMHL